MSEKKTTGAVIGCGSISKMHLGCMKEAGYRIGVLCDVDAGRAEQMKRDFGDERTRVVTSFEEAIRDADVDVVSVLTPPVFHAGQTVAALNAGKFVYCEKPVVRTLKEFDAIFAAEKSSGKGAYFTPGRMRGGDTPTVRQYVNDGEFGDIYRVESKHWRMRGRSGVDTGPHWFADSQKALGGILADMGLYFMDRAFHLTGWPKITSVSAVTFRPFPYDLPSDVPYDVEEHALIMARTEGKLTFTFELANMAYFDDWTTNTLMMLGNKGGMHLRSGRTEEFRFLTEKGAPGRYIEHRINWKEGRKTDTIIYEELAAAVRGTGQVKTATSSREALVLHEVMAMTYMSSHNRREIRPEDLDQNANIFIKA
ncbi:MAG: Gfo/Idh/MocA family oxidoreductase [Planctomycetes bacterium]|nr:Gfo/Idh/MocA family oxidoreductase [Planctomycetota bacterium]